MIIKINEWLKRTNAVNFSIYAIAAAFITYFSMYAFRKPFTAGLYEGFSLWGIDYKIFAITTQILGYATSKFIGIKVVSELKSDRRIVVILGLMLIAWLALLLFAVIPAPYNVFALFFNGLPLGMIWGVVFSYLEGRRFTELLGAGMSASFIVASGIVKATGKGIVYNFGVTEFWMPFLTGLIFVPFLLLGVYLLKAIPAPNEEDKLHRTDRVPMDSKARIEFFSTFAVGIILTVSIFVFLTIFRDIRDNFAVEIWNALGFADQPEILATTEIPVAIGVLIIIALMSFFKNNHTAFYINFYIISIAGFLLLLTTWLFNNGFLNPVLWMILNGFSMYLAYIAYHTFLFERWIALFKYKSNIGFLMYMADAFGYLGSVSILFIKNYLDLQITWLSFFNKLADITGIFIIVVGLSAIFYFRYKEKSNTVEPVKGEVSLSVDSV
jgi:MFS family permease